MSENWRKNAECAGEDPDMFDPDAAVMTAYFRANKDEKLVRPKFEQIRKAKAICGRCAVEQACLGAALENNEEVMIWGGMTVNEREQLRSPARSRRRRGA